MSPINKLYDFFLNKKLPSSKVHSFYCLCNNLNEKFLIALFCFYRALCNGAQVSYFLPCKAWCYGPKNLMPEPCSAGVARFICGHIWGAMQDQGYYIGPPTWKHEPHFFPLGPYSLFIFACQWLCLLWPHIQYNTTQYNAIHYNTKQYNTIQLYCTECFLWTLCLGFTSVGAQGISQGWGLNLYCLHARHVPCPLHYLSGPGQWLCFVTCYREKVSEITFQ